MTDYSSTINLPSTKFSMKANLSQKETVWMKFWDEKKIFDKLKNQSKEFPRYVLHDGPPYANGDLHLGHALNKILKDIICRVRFQYKYNVHYVPGWDCHGLPIEWKVEEKFRKSGKDKANVDIINFRTECRKFADKWVGIQKEQFSRFGIHINWNEIYKTMNKSAEISIVKELLKFLETGQLYLGFKPVMWSVVEQTALAEAEIEYKEKKSKAIYVKFPIVNSKESTSIVIWTTTPWTIPCNKAIAFSENLDYVELAILQNNNDSKFEKEETVIVCKSLVDDFLKKNNIQNSKIIRDVNYDEILSFECEHPLVSIGFEFKIKIFPSNHVTDEAGTGFVHIAPNHGLEDFEVGKRFKLKNTPTVDENGIYTKNINFFYKTHIFKADELVVQKLKDHNNLVGESDYNHSYPHSWRSKAPLIYRATSQWFISMEIKGLRKKALSEIGKVKWIPDGSKNRIYSMVKERPDWCVSRQRFWGVPITIFINKNSGSPLIDKKVNDNIVNIIEKDGVECWFTKPNSYFLPNDYVASDYEKVNSILDVWFDSGSSHVYVLKDNNISSKADLYVEGTDQHRGWFQTSLLESCANYGESPYKSVLTHGFVIDEKGKKMSKSLGNVISPDDVIKKYGADILRIWVSNSNFNEDIKISFENLERQSESYRKIRNTLRFILGNMKDFKKKNEHYESFDSLDKLILYKLFCKNEEIEKLYKNFNFNKVFQIIVGFCSQDLSAIFFDIRKDSLYCDSSDSLKVKCSKTVLWHTFNCLIRWISPIIPFTAEEAWQSWKEEIDEDAEESCHLLNSLDLPSAWKNDEIHLLWNKILIIKDLFASIVENKRNNGEIKSSLEAEVYIFLKNEFSDIKNKVDLSEILISSHVHFVDVPDNQFESIEGIDEVKIKVDKSTANKCPRCWKYLEEQNIKSSLCKRCESVLND